MNTRPQQIPNIDIIAASTKGQFKNPLDHIDPNIVVAARLLTHQLTAGHTDTPVAFESYVLSLTKNDFKNLSLNQPNTCIPVSLSRFTEKSSKLCDFVQHFKPLTFPVVHPAHVYLTCVALTVRRHVMRETIDLCNSTHPTKTSLNAVLHDARTTMARDIITDHDFEGKLAHLLESHIDPDAPITFTVHPRDAVAFQRDVAERHHREVAALPDGMLDADQWVRLYFDAASHLFDSDGWLTRAMLWRDRACKMHI